MRTLRCARCWLLPLQLPPLGQSHLLCMTDKTNAARHRQLLLLPPMLPPLLFALLPALTKARDAAARHDNIHTAHAHRLQLGMLT